jgi:hypothetical protein
MTPLDVVSGDSPVILAQPHGRTWLPDELRAWLNPNGQALADTDWHIGALCDGLFPEATVVRATVHRYVIDANRDPAGLSMPCRWNWRSVPTWPPRPRPGRLTRSAPPPRAGCLARCLPTLTTSPDPGPRRP